MSQTILALMSELKRDLDEIYRGRLRGVYLYGSYARGEESRDSDVDVLVVLDRVQQYGEEIDRTGHVVSELSLKYGLSISRVFVSDEAWRLGETWFLSNAREEAVAV